MKHRPRLPISKKIEILNRLAYDKASVLAREYKVSKASISSFKQKHEELRKAFASSSADFKFVLDKRLVRWINRKKGEGVVLTGPRIQRMAILINSKLGEGQKEGFKASNGWLYHFLERNHINLKVAEGSSSKTAIAGSPKPNRVTTTKHTLAAVKSTVNKNKTPGTLQDKITKSSTQLAQLIRMKYGKRRGKAKNVEEVDKPRGFDRGLELDQILGAANLGKTPLTLQFLVRWIGCDELDLIPAPELNEKAPEVVLAYYEGLSSINKQFEIKEKERLAIALRPVIVSKVEHMMANEAMSNDDLFRAVVQEATTDTTDPETAAAPAQEETATHDNAAMVQIPQDYNTDMSELMGEEQPQQQQPPMIPHPTGDNVDMGWVAAEEQIIQN